MARSTRLLLMVALVALVVQTAVLAVVALELNGLAGGVSSGLSGVSSGLSDVQQSISAIPPASTSVAAAAAILPACVQKGAYDPTQFAVALPITDCDLAVQIIRQALAP